MKDAELKFDRSCHVLYSKACKKLIQAAIAKHYPESQREAIWERVQKQYAEYLSHWRTDLGGKKNFHNAKGGTYDSFALMTYWSVCKAFSSVEEIEQMEEKLLLPPISLPGFINANRPFIRHLLYRAFKKAEKRCADWHDYEMHVFEYEKGQPLRYEFTRCPIADFARQFGLNEIMPALCNPDYTAMEKLHAHLVRKTTCSNGARCDYAIVGDRDAYLKDHPEYRDEAGYRRNR